MGIESTTGHGQRIGLALVLDIANSLQHSQTRLKRSLLFVFVTAEEKGLLGSRYFATHPTVPGHSIVADINTDMFLPIYPLTVLTVFGLDESTLGSMVRQVTQQQGCRCSPIPNRYAMPSFAAISTALSAKGSLR